MKTQIPLYRAKKIDSDEYVISMTISYGTIKRKRDLLFMEVGENKWCGIDPSTLAIHFPDIIDNEGTKLFASLSEDGKGGDLLEVLDCEDANYVARYDNYTFQVYAILPEQGQWEFDSFENCNVKVIGIKE